MSIGQHEVTVARESPDANDRAVRIFLIERQTLLAKALSSILAADDGIEVLGDAESIALAPLARFAPDLVLIDPDGQSAGVEELVTNCRELVPECRICILSDDLRPEVMQRALSAGTDGYILKDVTPADLVRAVKIVLTDGFFFDPRVAGRLLRERLDGRKRDVDELSPREREVLRLVAEGYSNKQIGVKLVLSEKTVKNHVSHILSKLDVKARTQAAVAAIRLGLV